MTRAGIPDLAVEGSGEKRHVTWKVVCWVGKERERRGRGSDKAISIPDSDKDKIGKGSGHDGESRLNATTFHRLQ